MSLSEYAREDLESLVSEEHRAGFLATASDAVRLLKKADKKDQKKATERRKVKRELSQVNNALSCLSREAEIFLDMRASPLLGVKNIFSAPVCAALAEAAKTEYPKQNTHETVTVLKQFIKIFLVEGFLKKSTSPTASLTFAAESIISEAEVKVSANSAVKSAIKELDSHAQMG